MRRDNCWDSQPRGGSLVWGKAASSFSLLSMSEPSFWLGAGRRVRDGIKGRPLCCGHRWLRRLAFKPPGLDLASERLAFVHAHVRVGQKRGEVVGVAAHDLTSEG